MFEFAQQNCFTNAFQTIQNSLSALSYRISTLNSSLIPKNNLPIYLQNYTFSSGGVLNPYFTIVGGLSTNETYRRTWNLVTAGTLSTAPNQIIFTYNFRGVNSDYCVGLQGTLAGTFIIDGQVYDASTYFTTGTFEQKILTLTLDLSKISLNTTGCDLYFNIFLADTTCNTDDCSNKCKNDPSYYDSGRCDTKGWCECLPPQP